MNAMRPRRPVLSLIAALSATFCSGGKKATTDPPPSTVSITVSPEVVSLTVGQSATLHASVLGSAVTGVTWQSNSPGVASVDGIGSVTGVSRGTALISARATADASKAANATI